jgi:hypothetical protein
MPVFCCSNQTAKQMQHAAHVLLFPFTQRLGIQPTSHSHRSGLQKDYQVARPHGILAETSMNTTVLASPRRLSTWDGVQCKHISRPPLHADKRPMVASQSIARDLVTSIARRRQAAS